MEISLDEAIKLIETKNSELSKEIFEVLKDFAKLPVEKL